MREMVRNTFTKLTVVATETHFIGCKFDQSIVSYPGGGLPKFINCTFTDTKWKFEGKPGEEKAFKQLVESLGQTVTT